MTPGTLVLLHAPNATAAAWDDLPATLRSSGLDVLAPDVPDETGPRYIARASLTINASAPEPPLILVAHGTAGPLLPGIALAQRAAHRPIGGYVFVDGSTVGAVTENELKDRRTLSEEGFVSVFAVVDTATGKVIAGPQILARGMAEDNAVFEEIQPDVVAALENAIAGGATDTYQLQQVMRRVIGQWVNRRLRRRPMIVPVVVEA